MDDCITPLWPAVNIQQKTRTKTFFGSVLFSIHLGLVATAYANPEGGVVVGGRGNIQHSGTNTTVNQSSQNMAIDWQSYNVQQNERVQYIQPNGELASDAL